MSYSSRILLARRSLFAQQPQARQSTKGRGRPSNKTTRTPQSSTRSPSTSTTSPKTKKPKSRLTPTRDRLLRPVVEPYEEPPILTPGVPSSINNKKKNSLGKLYRGGTYAQNDIVLPTVNVAALLDPLSYCRKSAFYRGASATNSGGAAAARWLRGKETVLQVLREQVLNKTSKARPRSYAMVGHGVPSQLLQNHIDMADSLLSNSEQAAECSFHNFHGDLQFDWMRVRSRDGTNKAVAWPPAISKLDESELQHQMDLYLAVMNRLVSTLGLVLTEKKNDSSESSLPDTPDENDDFVAVSSSSSSLAAPRHWNAEILRGAAYPQHLLPTPEGYEGPLPIVEWNPRKGSAAPGYVNIRLQGTAAAPAKGLRRKKREPVTLLFDACFGFTDDQRKKDSS